MTERPIVVVVVRVVQRLRRHFDNSSSSSARQQQQQKQRIAASFGRKQHNDGHKQPQWRRGQGQGRLRIGLQTVAARHEDGGTFAGRNAARISA